MRVEMFNAGWLTVPLGLLRKGEPMEEPIRVPVPAFLIETGDERILVDAGLHPDAIADPDAFYDREHAFGPFTAEQDRSIADQIDLSAVTRIILTHLHFDHAGALPLIPAGVPAVVQRAEWEAGADDEAVQKNFFLPPDYAGDRPIELVDGDHDLLGDGSIRLLLTPGHTPGHQSVQIGDLVLAGDVVHFTAALDDLRLPLFGDDLEAQARSAQRLRELRDAGATVIPSHEPELHHPGTLTA
jgi:N-acyl homoserine lactone hydrolase